MSVALSSVQFIADIESQEGSGALGQTRDARLVIGKLNFAGTYSTGGEDIGALLDDLFGGVDPYDVIAAQSGGYCFEYDPSTGKLKIMVCTVTFTVKTGTIGLNMEIGLTADAATASLVGNSGITADRTLTTNTPIGNTAMAELANGTALTGSSFDAVRFWAVGARKDA